MVENIAKQRNMDVLYHLLFGFHGGVIAIYRIAQDEVKLNAVDPLKPPIDQYFVYRFSLFC